MNNSNSKAQVLIIEDEKGIRSLLSAELSRKNYEVDTASDGEEGIEKVKNKKYNLVISDIMMPKLNGLEALKIIKKISPETEVIIITGYATVENAIQSMKDGAYDFIQKPFDLQKLFTLIEKALEKVELKALVAIYESSQAVFSTLKLEELLPMMIKSLKELLKADEVALLLFDHQSQLYLAAASFPLTKYSAKEFYLSLAERLKSSIKLNRSPIVIDVSTDTEFILEGSKIDVDIKSLVVCPIVLKGRKYGILCVAREKEHSGFGGQDLRNLAIFTSQMSQAIANTKLYEQLEIKISELEEINNQLAETKAELSSTQKLVEKNRVFVDIQKEMKESLSEALKYIQPILKDIKASHDIKKNVIGVKETIISCHDKILAFLK
ncbi:MAG: response regulator [Elusimicrobia bacterium]|nr:response regulator [Candidatus Liberimonas magnetica]